MACRSLRPRASNPIIRKWKGTQPPHCLTFLAISTFTLTDCPCFEKVALLHWFRRVGESNMPQLVIRNCSSRTQMVATLGVCTADSNLHGCRLRNSNKLEVFDLLFATQYSEISPICLADLHTCLTQSLTSNLVTFLFHKAAFTNSVL